MEIITKSINILQTLPNWTVEVVYDWWIIGMGGWEGNELRRDSENNFSELTWKISNVEQYSLKIKYHDLVIENIGKYIPALDPQTFKEEKLKSGIFGSNKNIFSLIFLCTAAEKESSYFKRKFRYAVRFSLD